MENLNAENIVNEIQSLIKALKDCGGWVKRGNGEGWFNHEILADALSVINSQEQRIKELTEENERLQAEITHLEGHREADIKAVKNLKAENERLRERNITLEQKLIILGCDEQYFFKPKVKEETANEN